MKTIFQKDYCTCKGGPRICGYGPFFCSLGCGKPVKYSVAELREMIKYRWKVLGTHQKYLSRSKG